MLISTAAAAYKVYVWGRADGAVIETRCWRGQQGYPRRLCAPYFHSPLDVYEEQYKCCSEYWSPSLKYYEVGGGPLRLAAAFILTQNVESVRIIDKATSYHQQSCGKPPGVLYAGLLHRLSRLLMRPAPYLSHILLIE